MERYFESDKLKQDLGKSNPQLQQAIKAVFAVEVAPPTTLQAFTTAADVAETTVADAGSSGAEGGAKPITLSTASVAGISVGVVSVVMIVVLLLAVRHRGKRRPPHSKSRGTRNSAVGTSSGVVLGMRSSWRPARGSGSGTDWLRGPTVAPSTRSSFHDASNSIEMGGLGRGMHEPSYLDVQPAAWSTLEPHGPRTVSNPLYQERPMGQLR